MDQNKVVIPTMTMGDVEISIMVNIEHHVDDNGSTSFVTLSADVPEVGNITGYTLYPDRNGMIHVFGEMDRFVRYISTIVDILKFSENANFVDNAASIFGKSINLVPNVLTPTVVISQDDPSQDVIDEISRVFGDRVVYAGDDVTIKF